MSAHGGGDGAQHAEQFPGPECRVRVRMAAGGTEEAEEGLGGEVGSREGAGEDDLGLAGAGDGGGGGVVGEVQVDVRGETEGVGDVRGREVE